MFVINSIISIILIVQLSIYLINKTEKEYQIIQQVGYDYKRYQKHISENSLKYIAINEFVMILTMLIYNVNIFISLIIMLFFSYYNLNFFKMSEKRYNQKLKLIITSRVKRLFFTESILNILILLFLTLILHLNIIYYLIIITYFVPIILILSILINNPIEKIIREKFKKQAQEKLSSVEDLTVVGITGSYGKTSIKNIVTSILQEVEPTLTTPASFNTPNGISMTINNELNILYKNFVAEMGAYRVGEIKELAELTNPSIGIVSSIGNQHLETFKTIENIQKTKMELIENLCENGIAIINNDEKYIKSYKIQRKDIKIYKYGINDINVDIYAKNIEYISGKMRFIIVDNISNKEYSVSTNLLGIFSVYNILAGYLVGKIKLIDDDKLISIIQKLKPVEHRLEMKKLNSKTYIIDDAFNGNIRGIKEGISIINKYREFGYKAIIITPGVIDLGKDQKDANNEIANEIKLKTDYSYIIGNYNKKYYENILNTNKSFYFDNFIDAYNESMQFEGNKIILIANDLPDKFN